MANKNFFEKLKDKISVEPSAEMDRQFWRKFDAEFKKPKFDFGQFFKYFAPVAVAATLAFVLYVRPGGDKGLLEAIFQERWDPAASALSTLDINHPFAQSTDQQNLSFDHVVLDKPEMFVHYDFFTQFGKIPVEDAEWEILLENKLEE